ncbi:MAG: adenosylhomocysteinase [Acidimicrobiales bacterium]
MAPAPSPSARVSDVTDVGLAPLGRGRVEWARRQMPVLATVRERFGRERPFDGLRIGASLHVTAETAVLLGTLAAGGAELSVCASNPLSTNDEVAAFLVVEEDIATFARRGEDQSSYVAHVDAVLDRRPHLTIDDGCDLVGRVHGTKRESSGGIVAGTEDTSTGAIRLRALAAAGGLSYPVLALSTAATRTLADNRHGTGQSTLDGIIRSTNILLAGTTMVVAGYGNCGRGVASRARGLGAIVIVTEVDPLRALEAVTDGFRVLPMKDAAAIGEIFVTATGNRDVLTTEHFGTMREGAIMANAGQFDVEIDVAGLRALSGGRHRPLRPMVDEYVVGPAGRRLLLLAEGRLVNLGAADGHPPQVMDLSFSVQALACEWLVANAETLSASVHDPPAAIDDQIAHLKLVAMGVGIDELSASQRDYLASWGLGAST